MAPSPAVIAVSEFVQIGLHRKQSSLARALESFVLTELYKKNWLSAKFIPGVKAEKPSLLREQRVEFVLSGTVISSERRDVATLQLIRVDNGEIISFTDGINTENPLPDFERLVSKILSEIKKGIPEKSVIGDHLIAISIPFENEIENSDEGFLIPLQMSKALGKKEIQHVKFHLYDEKEKDKKSDQSPTARLMGKVSKKNSKIQIDLELRDKFDFGLTHKVIVDEESKHLVFAKLVTWTSEVIKGMIKPDGQWRNDVSSLGDPDTLFRKAVDLYSTSHFDSALFYLRLAIRGNPNNLQYRKLIVANYLAKAEYKMALSELEGIPTNSKELLGPEDVEVFFQKGSAYLGLREYGKAADNFQIALKSVKDPELKYQINLNLAETYEQMEEIENAITYFLGAQATKRLEPEAYIGLAHLFIAQDSLSIAKYYLTQAIDTVPRLQRSLIVHEYINLAKLFLLQAKLDQALDIVKKVKNEDPNNMKALVLLGEIYLLSTDYDKAIENLKIAGELDKSDWVIFKLLSKAYLGKKEYEKAMQTLNEAIQYNPEVPQLYAEIAEMLHTMAKNAEQEPEKTALQLRAIEAAKKGLGFDQQFGLSYSLLAQVYFDMEKWEMARDNARKAIDLNPALISPYKILFDALQKLGKTEKELKKIIEEVELRYENNANIQQVILSLYHDKLFDFEKAYQVSRRLANNAPMSLEYKVALVESAIASGRNIEAEMEVGFLRESKDLDYTLRYVGLVLSVVTLLWNENWEEAQLTVNELFVFVEDLSKYFVPEWSFNGLLYYFHNIENGGKYADVIVLIEELLHIAEDSNDNEKSKRFEDWNQKVTEFLKDKKSSGTQTNLGIKKYGLAS
ncbi:MAG: tetratricopeptide repeat protein [Nitrospirales bacterium]